MPWLNSCGAPPFPVHESCAPARAIARLVVYCDAHRYYEVVHSLTPDGAWFGRKEEILARRKALHIRTGVGRRERYRCYSAK